MADNSLGPIAKMDEDGAMSELAASDYLTQLEQAADRFACRTWQK